MTEPTDEKIKKLRSGIFQKTDIVEIDVMFDSLHDKGLGDDKDKILRDSGLFVKFETLLKAGPLWKFNPTNLSLFIHDNKFEFDSALLIEDIKQRGTFTCKEIDKNLDLYEVGYTIRVLLINMHFFNDDVIAKSEYVSVETITGRITL